MIQRTAFWRESLDLSLVYLLCGTISSPFLFLMYLSRGTGWFPLAAVGIGLVVVALTFWMDSLEKHIRIFSRSRDQMVSAGDSGAGRMEPARKIS